MPEAQSVLLCDQADFRAIMNYLFYSISVCTNSKLGELMTKAFFETVVIFSSILGPVHVDTANADELATDRQNFYTNCKGK